MDGCDKVGKVVSVADDIGVNQNEEDEPFERNIDYLGKINDTIRK